MTDKEPDCRTCGHEAFSHRVVAGRSARTGLLGNCVSDGGCLCKGYRRPDARPERYEIDVTDIDRWRNDLAWRLEKVCVENGTDTDERLLVEIEQLTENIGNEVRRQRMTGGMPF